MTISFARSAGCAIALSVLVGAAVADELATHRSPLDPRLFSMIKSDDGQAFDGLSQLQTCDIWDPHDLTYSFSIDHMALRLDELSPDVDTTRFIIADIERLDYIDGHRVNYETPEDFLVAIESMALLRPLNPVAIDGGLSVSWARLLGRDGNTGEYRNHDDWREDAQRWRPAVEVADYWGSAHYRDGHTQDEWLERLEVFKMLFDEQFPDKPLMILIWHRERVGPDRSEEWITMRDYVEMGTAARDLGCHVAAFGRENDSDEFHRARQYFQQLVNAW